MVFVGHEPTSVLNLHHRVLVSSNISRRNRKVISHQRGRIVSAVALCFEGSCLIRGIWIIRGSGYADIQNAPLRIVINGNDQVKLASVYKLTWQMAVMLTCRRDCSAFASGSSHLDGWTER